MSFDVSLAESFRLVEKVENSFQLFQLFQLSQLCLLGVFSFFNWAESIRMSPNVSYKDTSVVLHTV